MYNMIKIKYNIYIRVWVFEDLGQKVTLEEEVMVGALQRSQLPLARHRRVQPVLVLSPEGGLPLFRRSSLPRSHAVPLQLPDAGAERVPLILSRPSRLLELLRQVMNL